MSDSLVDYDPIAKTYDFRYAVNDMKGTLHALQELVCSISAQSVLEVGCGTGHWLAALSPIVKCVFGIDLSTGMLTQARRQDMNIMLVRGQAGQLPYASTCVDMIFSLNAIHHFPDKQAFINEAYRLMRPEGALVIIGSDPPEKIDDWYIYRYFPGTYERDIARFPQRKFLLKWISQAGFEQPKSFTIEHFSNQYHGRSVFADPFLIKESTSQLILLSDEAYAQGILRIENDIESAEREGEQILFSSDIHLHMLIGMKN